MKIARGDLLAKLNEANVGVSSKETIEQSNCFVFQNGQLVTFNENVMVKVPSPLDFDVVVVAADFLNILAKMPDDTVDVSLRDGELRIKARKGAEWRRYGLTVTAGVELGFGTVPRPDKWHRLPEGINGVLQQAARTCGDDEAEYLATCVHVTPERVEACDNSRLYRVEMDTGFPGEILIPATGVHALEGLEIVKVGIGQGWTHFKTASGAEISLRSSHEKYHEGLDDALRMKDPIKIVLPTELKDIVSRAEIFHTADYDEKISVRLSEGELVITSRKESGWAKERKGIAYSDRPLAFDIQPQFLVEMLARTRDVLVDERKMKMANERVQFVVSLSMKAEAPESEEE